MSERYVIREIEGYSIDPRYLASQGGNARTTTDVMVLDSHDCYRVVGYWSGEGRGGQQRYERA